jgi:norsolorinic acid ketoreductase
MMGPALETKIEDFRKAFEVNTLGPIVLFQTFHHLLIKSIKEDKKFVITSTGVASQSMPVPMPLTAYGVSKAAVNHFGIKVNLEHGEKDKIAALMIHPGWSFLVHLSSPIL